MKFLNSVSVLLFATTAAFAAPDISKDELRSARNQKRTHGMKVIIDEAKFQKETEELVRQLKQVMALPPEELAKEMAKDMTFYDDLREAGLSPEDDMREYKMAVKQAAHAESIAAAELLESAVKNPEVYGQDIAQGKFTTRSLLERIMEEDAAFLSDDAKALAEKNLVREFRTTYPVKSVRTVPRSILEILKKIKI